MVFTNDFFAGGSIYPNDDFVQLIDSNTLEIFLFRKTTQWINGTPIAGQADGAIFIKKGNTNDYYQRIFSSAINVKWFGAIGDGNTDDTSTIQSAFNFLFASRDNNYIAKIYFPPGFYLVSTMLVFPSECELEGEDKRSTKIFTNDNHYDLLYVFENAGVPNEKNASCWTTIKNITLAGKNRDANVYGWFPEQVAINNNNSGIVFNALLRTFLDNIIVEGFETAGLFYNNSYYHRFHHILIRKNKIGLLATGTCTSIDGINSEFRFNSVGHAIHDSYACSFVNCMFESNFGQYMINRIDYNSTPEAHNGVAIYLNNSFNNVYSNCYFEAHVCTFYYISSFSNIIDNSFICAGTTYDFTNLDGNVGFLRSSKNNIFEKNFYYTSIDRKAKYYFSAESTNNFFDFIDDDTLADFIVNLDDINNFSNKTAAPTAICPTYNKTYYNGKVSKYYQLGSSSGVSRPPINMLNTGFQFYDTNLNKPIWFDGSDWRDSSGVIV